MTGNDHNVKTPCASCSMRACKHAFLVIIILCFFSVLLLRLKPTWSPLIIRVNRDRDHILGLNNSQKLQLAREAVVPQLVEENFSKLFTTKLPPQLVEETKSKPNVSSRGLGSWSFKPTSTTERTTTAASKVNADLLKAYKFLYGDTPPKTTEKLSTNRPACPAIPPNLIGPIKVKQENYPISELNSLNFAVSEGGTYTPPKCTPAQKVAIVIPFRNRDDHLAILLLNLHPYLQKQQRHYTIFVVNQVEGSKFNRALLMNVGFVEAVKKDNYDCIIFHDVDLLPENDKNIYSCPEHDARHMSAYINKFNYDLPYTTILGGIVAIRSVHFVKINGYSNQFFGWGGEDDDFSMRCRRRGLSIVRYPKPVARYQMILHDKDSGNEPNPRRFEMLKNTADRQNRDGLNTLTYHVNSIQPLPLYTRINVVVNQRQVMNARPHTLPDFLQAIHD